MGEEEGRAEKKKIKEKRDKGRHRGGTWCAEKHNRK